jgi:hypothetical protein
MDIKVVKTFPVAFLPAQKGGTEAPWSVEEEARRRDNWEVRGYSGIYLIDFLTRMLSIVTGAVQLRAFTFGSFVRGEKTVAVPALWALRGLSDSRFTQQRMLALQDDVEVLQMAAGEQIFASDDKDGEYCCGYVIPQLLNFLLVCAQTPIVWRSMKPSMTSSDRNRTRALSCASLHRN